MNLLVWLLGKFRVWQLVLVLPTGDIRHSQPGPVSLARCQGVLALYRRLRGKGIRVKVIVSGGKTFPGSHCSDAEALLEWLVEPKDINPADFYLEATSLTSAQNVVRVLEKMAMEEMKEWPIVTVSQWLHALRLFFIFLIGYGRWTLVCPLFRPLEWQWLKEPFFILYAIFDSHGKGWGERWMARHRELRRNREQS